MSDEVQTENVDAPVEGGQDTGLSLQDVATIVQIIDLCSKRGAFEGPELESVGGLRSRVVAFVNAAAPKDGEAPEGEVPVVEPPEEDSDS